MANVKYHLTDDGPKVCRASKISCPIGGDHYYNVDAAFGAFESKMAKRTLPKISKIENSDPKNSGEIREYLNSRNPNTDVWVGLLDGVLSLDSIHSKDRGRGYAKKAMTDLIELADRNGWTVTLSPSGVYGSNVNRLKKFYKEFGFIENRGRNRNFKTMDSMWRKPPEQT